MNLKKLSLAAAITVSMLAVNVSVNAAELDDKNIISDMGPTGYAAPIQSKPAPSVPKRKKLSLKRKPMQTTGAACPIQRPAPSGAGPSLAPCPVPSQTCVPCNPCPQPCQPCPSGAAAPIIQSVPCPAPCQPCVPCQPCNPCAPVK